MPSPSAALRSPISLRASARIPHPPAPPPPIRARPLLAPCPLTAAPWPPCPSTPFHMIADIVYHSHYLTGGILHRHAGQEG
eukprot:7068693-Pyramimonas_sp.AAC.1